MRSPDAGQTPPRRARWGAAGQTWSAWVDGGAAAAARTTSEALAEAWAEVWWQVSTRVSARLVRAALRMHSGAAFATFEDRAPALLRARGLELAAVAPHFARALGLASQQDAPDVQDQQGQQLPQLPRLSRLPARARADDGQSLRARYTPRPLGSGADGLDFAAVAHALGVARYPAVIHAGRLARLCGRILRAQELMMPDAHEEIATHVFDLLLLVGVGHVADAARVALAEQELATPPPSQPPSTASGSNGQEGANPA